MPDALARQKLLSTGSERKARWAHVASAIERAGELLPLPGPIAAFAFLNTLQALEHLPFDEGMRTGARLYGCQPYLAEDHYRDRLAEGRILPEDLTAVLHEALGAEADEPICELATRFELRRAMLQHRLSCGPTAETRWFIAETSALERMREDVPPDVCTRFVEETRQWTIDALRGAGAEHRVPSLIADLLKRYGAATLERWSPRTWEAFSLQTLLRVCREGVHGLETAAPPARRGIRHRDWLLEATGEDSDLLVHDALIRFCAAFADQGLAAWSLPNRERGFYQAFCGLYRQPGGPPQRWLQTLSRELTRLHDLKMDPADSILESLELLGVAEEEWDDFIVATLLALRGWAGMLWHMEARADRVPLPAPTGTLVEFLAVRLTLERLALAGVARDKLHYDGSLAGLASAARAKIGKRPAASVEQRAMRVFQLAQLLGWAPPALLRLTKQDWAALVGEIERFSGMERRWVFHQAFERRLRTRVLDALSVHVRRQPARVAAPCFQICTCLDAREESFRRYVEELAPDAETFGAAGFFGIAMYYRGAADAHYAALCPIVVKPQHWVVEDVAYTFEDSARRRAKTRRALGAASHQVHVGSRGAASGALLTAGLGVLASVPLVARVLFPRLTARIRKTFGRLVQPPPSTQLRLERSTLFPGPEEDQVGYTVEEMANLGERWLRDIGLTGGFARVVIILGHGASCLNNPHKSVYDCGACSGNPGGPNGRALAAMLNDLRVREALARRGLAIPGETSFVGGMHNTTVDSLAYYDLDALPKPRLKDFESARRVLEEACRRNAHERCRRFDSAPPDLDFEEAHEHVESRSEDLAQARPEFGNASNAVCIVGRRERTRGLYLDRRAFLASYDPTQDDDERTILARILSAVVPVCEGINMQYSLSYIDNAGWACGTKLPHNVTSLLGVMDGAASDLRPGLPWQSVEIHEPARLLFVVETTPETMFAIMERNELVGRILRNGWAQLAVLDPDSNQIQVFKNGRFQHYQPETEELPIATSSTAWHRGQRGHLGFAVIQN